MYTNNGSPTILEQYREWLYDNYTIPNGKTLTRLEEDPQLQEKFIEDMGLPDDIDIV